MPAEVVWDAKRHLVDSLGCAVGAYHEMPPTAAREYALTVSASPGATVLGTSPHRTSLERAAFTNGLMVRYFDFNDTSMAVDGGHPSDNLAAILAAAEYASAPPRRMIVGAVVAYEIQGRLSDVCGLSGRGFDTVTYLAISAAAGAGVALGLDQSQMSNALAIAAVSNVALGQIRVGSLSMWKAAAAGSAASGGALAALLASRGITGPAEAFDGRRGFFTQLTAGGVELAPFGSAGRRFKIQDGKFKVYPTEYHAQCAIDPALELRTEIEGRIDDIDSVTVDTYEQAVDHAAASPDRWAPTNRETADHSLPYVLAVALKRGKFWLDDFTLAAIKDPEVHALMQKIVVRRDPRYKGAYPEASPFQIEIRLRSGRRLVRETRFPRGHQKNTLTNQDIETKFRRLTQESLSDNHASEVLGRLWGLENATSVREVIDMFAYTPGPTGST